MTIKYMREGLDTTIGPDGMQKEYLALSPEERAKGFVRPYRDAYRHVGAPGGSAGCGAVTTMGRELSETYARQPDFYSGTFCVRCKKHLPVGAAGEFVWYGFDGVDGERVGT